MNTITSKLKESITAATGLKALYQSAEQLNRICDNVDYPCAFFFLLGNNSLNTDGGHIRERINVAVFFVDKTNFDFSAEENEQIIQGCKEKALQWLKALYTDNNFRLIATNNTERVYDFFDAQLTGFAINVTLEELIGEYRCKADEGNLYIINIWGKPEQLEIITPSGLKRVDVLESTDSDGAND